jgi:hypothetical protein
MGHHPESTELRNLMFRLRDDGGYVSFSAAMGTTAEALHHIRLAGPGRQEVEGWPKASGVSAADTEALLAVLDARADDPDVPEPPRKWRAMASAIRDVGVGTASSALWAWLRSIGAG